MEENKDQVKESVKEAKNQKITKEEKAKIKFKKLETKRLKKEQKKQIYEKLNSEYNKFDSKEEREKRAKTSKIKKVKDKIDYRLAFKEFPVKVVKEIQKVRWPKRSALGMRLFLVLLFMVFFAVTFYLVDLGIQHLFTLIKIL